MLVFIVQASNIPGDKFHGKGEEEGVNISLEGSRSLQIPVVL
jgi:hypothetical protein